MPVRIAADTLPALIVGLLLIAFAVVLAWHQLQKRRTLTPLLENDPLSRVQADRQLRRRLQVSGMLGIVGVMIPFGDQLDWFFKVRPVLFVVYWMAVLLLVAWIVLMALGDWLSMAAYSNLANIQLRIERRRIEEEVRRYHAERDGDASADGGV